MKPIVRKTPRAFSDLIEIAAYIAFDNTTAADRFLAAASDAFELLAAFPDIGAKLEHPNEAVQGMRFWPIKGYRNYIIYYRRRDDGIEVIRDLHAARDSSAIFADGA